MTFRKCCIYARLSRPDEDAPGTTEEKLNAQVESCRRLAAAHNLPVHEVLIERASGGSLAGRPELLKLLLLCRRGEVSHIICTFADRLSRLDGRDRVDFEEALTDGGVTVITTTGVTPYNHEEEPFGRRVLAEAAAYELRAFSRRLKERNKQKLEQNKRTGGGPPYGYRKDMTAPGGYAIVPHEYVILVRILRWALECRSEHALAQILNREQIPPPGARGSRIGRQWRQTTIRNIVLNPFYAGRHGQRNKIVKVGGRKILKALAIDEFVIAPGDGDWEYPISFEEYSQLRTWHIGRYRPVPRVGLITGLLFCPDGGPMARQGVKKYGCTCAVERPELCRFTISRKHIEGWAVEALGRALCALPSKALGVLQNREKRSDLYVLHARAQRATRDAFSALEQLASNREVISQYSDQGLYDEMLKRAAFAHKSAKMEEARLSSLLAQPEMDVVKPVVEAVRRMGFEFFWSSITEDEQRSLLRDFIERIEMQSKERRKWSHHPPPRIVLREWVRKALGHT